jgi:hypothetical protein
MKIAGAASAPGVMSFLSSREWLIRGTSVPLIDCDVFDAALHPSRGIPMLHSDFSRHTKPYY